MHSLINIINLHMHKKKIAKICLLHSAISIPHLLLTLGPRDAAQLLHGRHVGHKLGNVRLRPRALARAVCEHAQPLGHLVLHAMHGYVKQAGLAVDRVSDDVAMACSAWDK